MSYQILPSILAADITCLGEEVQAVMQAGADMIHVDVMDNHYVPNLTYGPQLCLGLKQRFKMLPIDVHLMVSPVDSLINQFAKAGVSRISIHADATIHLDRSLQSIKEQGCAAGLALNPSTSLDCLQWCMERLDYVLVMTVNPGFGGQQLIGSMLKKMVAIHQQYPHLPICVDGGITPENIACVAKTGATQFIAGSAIFNSPDYTKTIRDMRQRLASLATSPHHD